MLYCYPLDFGPFDSMQKWNKERDSLIFTNKQDLVVHQQKALQKICDYYNVQFSDCTVSNKLPSQTGKIASVTLRTSGSQNNLSREYQYSEPQYKPIENHHIWRIEREHDLLHPGKIIEFHYSPTYIITDDYKDCYLGYGGFFHPSGIHNEVHFIFYRRNTKDHLTDVLEQVKKMKPKYFICSPSQIELVYDRTKGNFQIDCPVISTRETLYPHVRKYAEKMFSKVIDKMRCWDGGLGFYECKYGRKHLYDELSYCEVLENGLIASTDFYNLASKFIRYTNLDSGKIEQGLCDCGVYGNFLTEFQGQSASLIRLGDFVYAGSALVEDLNSLFKYGGCTSYTFTNSIKEKYGFKRTENAFEGLDVLYHIRQNIHGDITFKYKSTPSFNEIQKKYLEDTLQFVFYRQANDQIVIPEKELQFRCPPRPIEIIEDENFMTQVKGIRNKSLCVETEIKI